MRENARRDKFFAFLSWLIVFGLLFAAFQVATLPSTGLGPVAQTLGVATMKALYAGIYSFQAILLAYAKLFKKKKMRKGVLMSIYLFMGFTTILSIGISGWTWKFLDNALISITAAACWLHWKFRTEYIDPAEFDKELDFFK